MMVYGYAWSHLRQVSTKEQETPFNWQRSGVREAVEMAAVHLQRQNQR